MNKISELNSISTLLSRCLRLAPTITDDNSRLATAGWLGLEQTGFPPVRLITLSWAHNYFLSILFPDAIACAGQTVLHNKQPTHLSTLRIGFFVHSSIFIA